MYNNDTKLTAMASASKAKKQLKDSNIIHARTSVVFDSVQENCRVHGESHSTIYLTGVVMNLL